MQRIALSHVLGPRLCAAAGCLWLLAAVSLQSAEPSRPAVLEIPDSTAATEADMKPYTDRIDGSEVKFQMLPIPAGTFVMGSPEGEAKRNGDEGPQHEVKLEPFWMGKYEVTWDEYSEFMFSLDMQRRQVNNVAATERDRIADALTHPTKPYTDMSFGMGKGRNPAICMTRYAAEQYCNWLSAKTGRYYRLPTEAEWEYACRAGTKTAYHFGDDASQLGDYAWHYENADDKYHAVGQKKPNPWGLHDMHGNVTEWCLDQYEADFYGKFAGKTAVSPLASVKSVEPCVVRGGAWDDDPDKLRSAARRASHKDWKQQDPQIPQSIWYYTDAQFAGFRIVRPLVEPSAEEKLEYQAPPK